MFKSGYVALIGRPNVGKSTLLNRLMGRKLSIVTPKTQTTRHRIMGILSERSGQMIFLDTPGLMEPRSTLDNSMMHQVRRATADADVVVFMADARDDQCNVAGLARLGDTPAILALNKVDLTIQEKTLPLADQYLRHHPFAAVIPISALTEFNLDTLMQQVRQHLPAGPQLYPDEMISEHPERFFVAEIIREKVFRQFRAEVPYAAAVIITQFVERNRRKDLIAADIVVERASQKGILIGKGGTALKNVGIRARRDIEAFLSRPVYLKLFVRVRPNWRNNATHLRQYGY
ncbi:MAG: GTPase Era [Bacteroidota bacterium]|nr:GTPase Era [Bacteroidota bacterium]